MTWNTGGNNGVTGSQADDVNRGSDMECVGMVENNGEIVLLVLTIFSNRQ